MYNQKSLVKALQTRTNALMMIGRFADFKTRKMIANGIWNSKLCYCLSVFGSTEGHLLTALQRMQNCVAKVVCRKGRRYSPRKALKEIGWLPVMSLVKYHSLVQAKKVLECKKPEYLHEKLVGGRDRPSYATRLCIGGNLRSGPGMKANLNLTKQSWRWRVRYMWEEVPILVRSIQGSLNKFKAELRKWLWSLL